MLNICLLTVEDESPEQIYWPIHRELDKWLFVVKGIVALKKPANDNHRWVTNLADWRLVVPTLTAENDLVFCTVDLRIPALAEETAADVAHGLTVVHEVKSRHDDGLRCCILSGVSGADLQEHLGGNLPDVLFDFKGDADEGYANIVNYIKSQVLAQIQTVEFAAPNGPPRVLTLSEATGRLRDQYLSKAPYFVDGARWYIPTLLVGSPGLGRRTFCQYIAFLADAELVEIDLTAPTLKANRELFRQLEQFRTDLEQTGPRRRLCFVTGLDEYQPELHAEEGRNCLRSLRALLEKLRTLSPGAARACTLCLIFGISGQSRLKIRSRDTRSFIPFLEENIGELTNFPLAHLGRDETGCVLEHPHILRIPTLHERGPAYVPSIIERHLEALRRTLPGHIPGYKGQPLTLAEDVFDLLARKTDWAGHGNLTGVMRVLDNAFARFLKQRAGHQFQITRACLDEDVQERLRRTILNMDNVRLEFPGRAGVPLLVVEKADLHVQEGELLVILGPSGCGKSTILRMMAGLLMPTSGAVSYRGEPQIGPSEKVGFIFQDYSLFPWLTVRKNIEFGPRARGIRAELVWPKVEHLLDVAKLTGFEDVYPHQLSGGMRQRVAIIRSLANEPDVLLMDEPFGALDVQTRWQMQDFLIETKRLTGKTIVFVTHDIDEAVYVSDRIYVASPRPLKLTDEIRVPFSAEARKDALRRDAAFVAVVNDVRKSLLAAAGAPAAK